MQFLLLCKGYFKQVTSDMIYIMIGYKKKINIPWQGMRLKSLHFIQKWNYVLSILGEYCQSASCILLRICHTSCLVKPKWWIGRWKYLKPICRIVGLICVVWYTTQVMSKVFIHYLRLKWKKHLCVVWLYIGEEEKKSLGIYLLPHDLVSYTKCCT